MFWYPSGNGPTLYSPAWTCSALITRAAFHFVGSRSIWSQMWPCVRNDLPPATGAITGRSSSGGVVVAASGLS